MSSGRWAGNARFCSRPRIMLPKHLPAQQPLRCSSRGARPRKCRTHVRRPAACGSSRAGVWLARCSPTARWPALAWSTHASLCWGGDWRCCRPPPSPPWRACCHSLPLLHRGTCESPTTPFCISSAAVALQACAVICQPSSVLLGSCGHHPFSSGSAILAMCALWFTHGSPFRSGALRKGRVRPAAARLAAHAAMRGGAVVALLGRLATVAEAVELARATGLTLDDIMYRVRPSARPLRPRSISTRTTACRIKNSQKKRHPHTRYVTLSPDSVCCPEESA